MENSTKLTEKLKKTMSVCSSILGKTKEGGLSPLIGETFSFNTVPCQEAAPGYNAGCRVSSVGGTIASMMEKTWPSVFLLNR